MPRLRLRAMQQKAMGGAPVGFDERRPWDFIWKAVLDEHGFWQDQVREPAQCVQIGSLPLSGVLGGDAVVRGAGPVGKPGAVVPSPPSSSWQSGSVAVKQKPFRQPMRAHEKFHSVDDAGLHKVNRKGIPLCEGFQNGSCVKVADGTKMVCGADHARVHQCARCLIPGHGAHQCHA
eukprot:3213847-Amphidinium_carterae.1